MIETTERDAGVLGLPDLPPRRQVLLQDPVATYLAGLDESTKGAVQRSLRRVAKLVEVPSIDAVPWEHLRYGHYQAIKGALLAYRRDPDDPNSGLSPDPIPVDEWLQKVSRPGWELETMPDDSLIAGGPYDGGHVLMVHNEEEDNTFLFAIPPVAIPLLGGLLAEDQHRALLSRTPRLSALAGR